MPILGGVSEVADWLGISRQRFTELRARNDFPEPVADLASGPIWDKVDIDRWAGSGARRGPGRPSTRQRVVGDRFVLETPPLGAGGFADVYRAIDRRDGSVVAVKVLRDTQDIDPVTIERFHQELRIMRTFDHPNVAKIIDHGDVNDTELWYAMPLAVGSLTNEITSMTGDLAAVSDLARQLCAGVGYVHSKGVLHRDLKPDNILRSPEGAWQVADFGLAHDDHRVVALTSTHHHGMGTSTYASPEQWEHPKRAEVRDDIYSIGKVLQHAIGSGYPVGTADRLPDSPLRPVIQRATGPRESRYQDTTALLNAIDQAVSAYTQVWEDPESRLMRLRPRLAAAAVDTTAADELLDWFHIDDIDAQIKHVTTALVTASPATIRYMWSVDPAGFRAGWARCAELLGWEVFDWSFCDTIADGTARVVAATADDDVLREAVTALARLGHNHTRWHVRDVLVAGLQGIREPRRALAALEGLQEAPPADVVWAISEFAVKSIHPVLRDGIAAIRAAAR